MCFPLLNQSKTLPEEEKTERKPLAEKCVSSLNVSSRYQTKTLSRHLGLGCGSLIPEAETGRPHLESPRTPYNSAATPDKDISALYLMRY